MFKLHSGLATGLSINDPGNVCAGARLCESVHPLVITLYARLYCLLQSLCAFPYIASLYSAVFKCGVSLLHCLLWTGHTSNSALEGHSVS